MSSPEQQIDGYGIFDFLASLDGLNDQSIEDFQNKLSPEGKAVFKEASGFNQLILAALNKLTPDQIRQLTRQQCDHSVLVHDFHNLVQVYYCCIEEE